MQRIFVIAIALAAHGVVVAPAAHAAEPAKSAPATDANARVPTAAYHSVFSSYQPFREQKLAPWREANDEAHQTGGHIGIVGGAAGKPPALHPPGHKK